MQAAPNYKVTEVTDTSTTPKYDAAYTQYDAAALNYDAAYVYLID